MRKRNIVTALFCMVLFAQSAMGAPSRGDGTIDPLIADAYSALFGKKENKSTLLQPVRIPQSKSTIASRQAIINAARRQLKVPYRWGGTNRFGFDCSGLMQYVYRQVAIDIPRTAFEQYVSSKKIKRSELQPGDLIFFHTRRRSKNRVDHVGMYLGRDRFIHAPRRGRVVSIDTLNHYWKKRIVSTGRAI